MDKYGTGYSLWLMPAGGLKTRLQEKISALAAAYGGPVNSFLQAEYVRPDR